MSEPRLDDDIALGIDDEDKTMLEELLGDDGLDRMWGDDQSITRQLYQR